MSAHRHLRALSPDSELHSELGASMSELEARMAEWVLDAELPQASPLRGIVGVSTLCAVSLALWLALIWAIAGTVG